MAGTDLATFPGTLFTQHGPGDATTRGPLFLDQKYYSYKNNS